VEPGVTRPGAEAASARGPEPDLADVAAQLVRKELETMLRAQEWLVPDAFPASTWETPEGAPPGTVRLALDVNLLENGEAFTPEELKRRLNATLDDIPLLGTKGRSETATYRGVSIDSVELVASASESSPATRYRIRTTSLQPSVSATAADAASAVPTRSQVEEGIRGFFSEQTRKGTLKISEPFPEVTTVGPKVARSLQADALVAFFISVLGIVFYVSLRFEFIYGLAGIVALAYDVLFSIGIMALTDTLFPTTFPVKFNLNELAAILTIIGFSINDTIVLFDRIRENNELLSKRRITLEDNVNISINQTLSRTLWTSTMVLIVTVTLIAFGGEGIRGFAYVFAVGTVSGVFSTVFLAAPTMLWLHRRAEARRAEMAAIEEGADRGRADRRR
jgi:preprotein translocase SecF subunit